ncbi:MAG: NAD-dependent epimerase/dehydratase family protein [Schleiferiaceae bacterium]
MILVTGGTGLLGSHLMFSLLSKGEKVRASHRKSSHLESVKHVFSYYVDTPRAEELFQAIEWVEADLLNVDEVHDLLEGIDTVYHCAAIISFYPKDADAMIKLNPQVTALLVNESLERTASNPEFAFCHVSSVAALGRKGPEAAEEPDGYLDEDALWTESPENSNYAKSKYLAEMEVWRGVEEGLNATIVNPCIILGPGYWEGGSGKLFSSVYNQFPYYTEGVNAFVDVRDVVDCMVKLVDQKIWSERFLTTGENTSYKDLFFQIADALGVKRPHKKPNKTLMELVWRVEWLRSVLFGSKPLVTKETARSARGVYRYSSAKIEKRLGFTFRPLAESVAEFSQFFRQDHS